MNLGRLGELAGCICMQTGNNDDMPDQSAEATQRTQQILRRSAELIAGGKPKEAVDLCQAFLRQNSGEPKIYFALAVGLAQCGRRDESAAAYRQAIRLWPAFYEARMNLGTLLSSTGQFEHAIAELSQAAQLRPQAAEAYINLSDAHRAMWRIDSAIENAERAISLNPAIPEGHNCLGAALASKGEFDRAIAEYRQAITLRSDYPAAHLNLGLALLVTGNLGEGFSHYEWRTRCDIAETPRRFSRPSWTGQNLQNKTILLYPEQGFGDAIHFIRYAPLIAQMGAKIWLESPAELYRLFASIPSIERMFAPGKTPVEYDFHCPLPALPHAFKTTLDSIPGNVPYLVADPADIKRWRKRIDRAPDYLQIGLAWSGNAANRNERNRSVPLAKFSPLARNGKRCFHSLQIAPPPPEAGISLLDWSSQLIDFTDTAALIANLDLIITVDTAVAHLAGAMGKKVWLLLSDPPDWRWMLDRADTPWYPTMRLFRQQTRGDWDSVIASLPIESQF